MSANETTPTTSQSQDSQSKDSLESAQASSPIARRSRQIALGLVVLAAVGLWGAGRLTYVTAHVVDDKSGEFSRTLVGSVWDPALTPLALAMLACLILSLAVQPVLRRILGAVVAVLAGIASFRSVTLLTAEPDLARVREVLVSGTATQRQNAPETISDWAHIAQADVHTLPVALAIAAAACGVIGGIILVMRPGEKSEGNSRYLTPEARREVVHDDLEANPDSGRVLWDALDAGVDPTDDDDFSPSTRRH